MHIFFLRVGEATKGLPARLNSLDRWFRHTNQRECHEAIHSAANAEILETEALA